MKLLFHIILFSLVLLNTGIASSQDIRSHRWKNRIVLIVTKDLNSKVYKEQIDILRSDTKGFEERKLIIYTKTKDKYRIGTDHTNWFPISQKSYLQTQKSKHSFEIVLIGLDGEVKLRQNEVVSKEKLFTLIDGMPMRRDEIKNKRS